MLLQILTLVYYRTQIVATFLSIQFISILHHLDIVISLQFFR